MASVQQARQREQQRLALFEQELIRTQQLTMRAQKQCMMQAEARLRSAAALAESLNPYGVLARGYAMICRDGAVLPVEDLRPGQTIQLQGIRAEADCTVQAVREIHRQENTGQ